MAIGTVGGEFVISGSTTADPLTPTNVRVVREGTRGSFAHKPVRIDNMVLFIQRQQRKIREFAYKFEADSYNSPDITILSNQVSKGGISEIAYQQEPSTVIWGVKNDGQLIGVTYLRDQDVIAWHRHKIGGSFGTTAHGVVESLAVIPSATHGEDELWMIVKRTIGSATRRYVELLTTRFDPDENMLKSDAFFIDSGLTLNTPLTLTGITRANPAVVTSSSHGLLDGDLVDLSKVLGMTEVNGERYRVIEKTTNTFEIMAQSGKPVAGVTQANPGSVNVVGHGFSTNDEVGFLDVGGMTELNGNGYTVTKVDDNNFTIGVNTSGYTAFVSGGNVFKNTTSAAFTAYASGGEGRKVVTQIDGLDHLTGETVQILGDGNVYPDQAVSTGSVSSFSPGVSVAQIGLGYSSILQTLRPEAGSQDGTSQGKTKRIFDATVRFVNTLGCKIGPSESINDEINFRSGSDPMDSSPPLFSGDKSISFPGGWGTEGQAVVLQQQPLPIHVNAVMTRLITNDG